MKIRPPWSRRRWTQPATRACVPARSAVSCAAPGVAVAVGPRGMLHDSLAPRRIVGITARWRELALLSGLHVLERRASSSRDDRDVAGAEPVGVLELALQRAAGELELRREPGAGGRRGRVRRPRVAAPACGCASGNEQVDELGRERAARRRASSIRSTPGGPAGGGGRRAAELLDQAVVAAAAADPGLCPERVAGELEQRARVVVEAADERRVDLVAEAGVVEQHPHLRRSARRPRRRGGRAASGRRASISRVEGSLGVERPQRVEVDAGADLGRQAVLVGTQVRRQLLRGTRAVSRGCRGWRGAGAGPVTASASSSSASRTISSASARVRPQPIASAPTCQNWR